LLLQILKFKSLTIFLENFAFAVDFLDNADSLPLSALLSAFPFMRTSLKLLLEKLELLIKQIRNTHFGIKH
ncbi:MAG: hypothetical protein ACK55Z_32180, partial [bacterium]